MRSTRLTSALMLALAALLVVAVAGCAAPSTPSGTTGETTPGVAATSTVPTGMSVTVMESNFQFQPSKLNVPVGTVVMFVNQDSVNHHVVVGTEDLGIQQAGQTVSWTATTDGVYPLKCLIHPSMTGQIVVGNGTGGNPGGGGGSGTTTGTGGY